VYIVEIPSRGANALLNILRDVIPPDVIANLQHLRRFAKAEYLPPHLVVKPSAAQEDEEIEKLQSQLTTSHLLVGPTSPIALSDLETLFLENKDLFSPLQSVVQVIQVPVFAPTSAAQAAEWSTKYWPTIYKNTNPYGPHPAMVRRAELEVMADRRADEYMDLAHKVARECEGGKHGLGIGAVIVERGSSGIKEPRVVAVAGDARFRGLVPESHNKDGIISDSQGNVMAHAVLRAIAMVADKRLALEESEEVKVTSPKQQVPAVFTSSPLTPLELHYACIPDNLATGGYLCLDLELYLTHEPCIMCAMAILHSRFGRVVFGQSVPKSGALSAEVGSLEYGLFWREQLNWKYLCWQWESKSKMDSPLANETHN
jgi:tRNA-specific adenosine deaminase 3